MPSGGATRTIDAESVPYGLLRERQTATSGAGVGEQTGEIPGYIALLHDAAEMRLVRRDITDGAPITTAGSLLTELQRGPTDAERRRGLDSAVSAGMRLQVIGWRQGVLTVDVSGEPNPSADRLPLAVAQIVFTVTSASGVQAVLFESEDLPLSVPLMDGSLTSAALTPQDYTTVLAPGPAGPLTAPAP